MRRDQIGKTNENLTAHLFVPGQRILLRETTVTETEKTWRIEIEQRSLYVHWPSWFCLDCNEKSLPVIILNIGTDRSEQTEKTLIRLLLMEQSDQGLLCLLFCLHLLNTILHCKIQLFQL